MHRMIVRAAGEHARWFVALLAMLVCAQMPSVAAQTPAASPAAAPAQGQASSAPASPLQFELTFDPAITRKFNGPVYVMMSTHKMGEPRFGPSWFGNDPFFNMNVVDWRADTPLEMDDVAEGFPDVVSTVPENEYVIQAVMRINRDSPNIGDGPGTAYSQVLRKRISGATGGTIQLRIDKVVQPTPFNETDRIKLVELKSNLLSSFHGRDITMRAAVILPADYEQHPERKYPAMYWIGGFGSDHRSARRMLPEWDATGLSDRIIRVVLDPLCYGGHHVFADSDNNGPRGTALVQEFIPYLESTFRLAATPAGRFVSGHSSGGWSSLWLQTAYPDFFGGCWSLAPDPVDFRDFQQINLYEPGTNMYTDPAGNRRPLARNGDSVMIWYEPFAKKDYVMGEGGQLRSFEWVFSRKGWNDQLPEPMFDRNTGAVIPKTLEFWKRYDIRLVLETNWATLGPKLHDGKKIHVFTGDKDTFYLDGATRLLKESQQRLKSQAVIEMVPGADHGSVASPALRKRIDQELLAVFEAQAKP
jgi:hypothetical protein